MKSIDRTNKPTRGRPVANTHPVNLRLHADIIRQIDDWRRTQDDLPNRPEAIRRLIATALAEKSSR